MAYVQGLNYLAGCVMFHAGEVEAFFLMFMLFQSASLRDNYLPNFPGLDRHFD